MRKKSVATLLLSVLIVGAAFARTSEKPNVIIVLTDDQGYGDLGCLGNPILKTPELDRLHADSIRFTDFHVSSLCTPSRAAIMTGNNPGHTGAYRTSAGRTLLHRDEKTLANLFSDAGYATGMFGKWHLGDNVPHRPQDRGFQEVLWHRCGGIGQVSDVWGNDYFDDTYERNGTLEEFEGYCTDVWFRESLRFVEKNIDKPFFLYLALNAPHSPYRVPEEWAKPYQGNKAVFNPNFYGMIANIDYNMGIFRQRLSQLEIAENTILIFINVYPRMTPVRIDIGNPAENPTALCSQDWYVPAGNPPWNYRLISKLPRETGPWMLEVKKTGRYRITLRQFPKEANKLVIAERAKIEIAGQVKEQPVKADCKGVVFELDLPAGTTELWTYLYDKQGKAGGAYFTEVEAL
jgi:hypothetical protein